MATSVAPTSGRNNDIDIESQPFLVASKESGPAPLDSSDQEIDHRPGEALVSGRADGLSSPVYREKAGMGPGSLSMALHTELTKLAASKQARTVRRIREDGSASSAATNSPPASTESSLLGPER